LDWNGGSSDRWPTGFPIVPTNIISIAFVFDKVDIVLNKTTGVVPKVDFISHVVLSRHFPEGGIVPVKTEIPIHSSTKLAQSCDWWLVLQPL